MSAPGYDRFSLTARAEGRGVVVVLGWGKAVHASSADARRAAVALREAAERAEGHSGGLAAVVELEDQLLKPGEQK